MSVKRADGAAELEHSVINARRNLVEARKRRDEAKGALAAMRRECDHARAVEDSLFRQLVECEQEIHNLFRELVDTPSAFVAVASSADQSQQQEQVSFDDAALISLITNRTHEEDTTLRRLQDDLEGAEREYTKVSKLSQVQRAEMLRLVKSVAKEYRVLEATAAREESELFRVKQESQDVVARTQANKLRIMKELFQL